MENNEPQAESVDFEELRDAGYELEAITPDGVVLRYPGVISAVWITTKIEG